MSNTVIKIEGLAKRYQLGTIGYGSLQHDLKAWWAKLRGKEDPNAKIGQKSRLDLHGDFWALRDVGFEVQQGDRLGVVGRNGAGKSTLLKLLSRVTSPTRGSIKIKGRAASLLEVGTGFHAELTGRENIFLNGAILGMKRREIQAKYDEIVDFSGVEQFIDTPVKRYSSGMYVRLAFSVAAHLESEILIIDEVLAVGDTDFQKKCLGKMDNISKEQGRTILFVSHNLSALRNFCNRGLLLSSGTIAAHDGINQILDAYTAQEGDSTNAGVWKFPTEEKSPLQLSEARLITSGDKVTATVEARDEFRIEIDCVLKEPLDQLYGYHSITNQDGQTVLAGDSAESGGNPFAGAKPGRHTIVIGFPRRLLGHGQYSVYLNFTARSWPGSVCTSNGAIRFGVIDTTTARGDSRGAVLSTILPWTIKADERKV